MVNKSNFKRYFHNCKANWTKRQLFSNSCGKVLVIEVECFLDRTSPLMMKSSNNQVEVDVSESRTKTEEVFLPEIVDNKDEETESAASPEVTPRKDGIYLPTKQEDSGDSHISGSDNEHQGEIKREKPRVFIRATVNFISDFNRAEGFSHFDVMLEIVG